MIKDFEFVKEFPNIISGKITIRLYRSPARYHKYNYHVGFPKEFIETLCPLIEASPYWGEQHWREEDGFWIWWTRVMTDDEELPVCELQKVLEFKIDSLNKVVDFLRNAYEK